MKNISIAFLLGMIFASVIFYFSLTSPPVVPTEKEKLFDSIIDNWTLPASDMDITFSYFLKLKEARLGFIPDTVRALANLLQINYEIPKGVVIAQWILESKWGLCDMDVNNYFGHTFAATKKFLTRQRYVVRYDLVPVEGVLVRRQVRFSAYKDILECFLAHGQYLRTSAHYKDAFKAATPEMFVRALAPHYAADKDYALKLITLMKRYQLN